MGEAGYLVRRGLVAPPLLRSINRIMRARAARVMAALGDRPIGLGSVNGYRTSSSPQPTPALHSRLAFYSVYLFCASRYDELVQRSHSRWDVPMSENDLAEIWGPQGSVAQGVPWLELVLAILVPSAAPSFCGVVFSDPGSPAQQWHIDSPVRQHAVCAAKLITLPLRPSLRSP